VKSNFLLSFIRVLKLPVKILAGFLGNKAKRTKTEREKKQLKHVQNFAPAHYSWQKSIDKPKKKKSLFIRKKSR
jgi:hypothetical protein